MSLSPATSESALVDSLRPRLHKTLQPLLNQASPCLPALEKTCQKILSLTGGLTGADRLAQIISRDPALSCRVLQISNSIAYSPQQVITSISHAVSWLGLDTVRSIVTASQLVEQLSQWPNQQQIVSGVIARALVAAVHTNELGMALEYPSLSQLFSSTLLYSIGDLAIASQSQDLYLSYRRIPMTAKTTAARIIEETQLYGAPRLRIAQALGQMWALPPAVVELFSIEELQTQERWNSSQEMFKGLVIGCSSLIDAMTGPPSPSAIEAAKRGLLTGSGLPSHLFSDILGRALDRGKQLVHSAGLSFDFWDDSVGPEISCSIPVPPPVSVPSATVRPQKQGPSAIETNPLETLQLLQTALREAKDINTLLSTLVHALHRDGGFARVALALLNPSNTDQLVGRLLLGMEDPTPYIDSLSGSLTKDHPHFLQLMKRSDAVWIEDFTVPLGNPINPKFLRTWDPGSAIIAPLRVGTRPIGMLYCDNGPRPQQVQQKDYHAFQLFFGQTTLSINRLAGVL
ncbi:MAG: HDOD domain-containing protein [Nitrospira sp.]|nr:HDOD domain-containing protein [Nitrospira sp.]